jgi:glucokinase
VTQDIKSGEVIGIDLGGTAIKLGRYSAKGHCTAEGAIATPQPSQPAAVLAAIVQAIEEIDPQGICRAIGLGTPGPTDPQGRVARIAINLADWIDVPVADLLEQKTGRPTVIANDANCAGLGEAWLGAGCGYRDVLLLTLGTGVGGAIILNGSLFTGRSGTAGELGLITLNPEGPPCNSGNQGSLEQYASIGAILRQTGLEPDELGRRAAVGDTTALAFWSDYGRTLAAGLASLIYVLTPEAIILGGGISGSFDYFYPALVEEVNRRVLLTSREGLVICRAKLGNQAGQVGAAKLAWDVLNNPVPKGNQP